MSLKKLYACTLFLASIAAGAMPTFEEDDPCHRAASAPDLVLEELRDLARQKNWRYLLKRADVQIGHIVNPARFPWLPRQLEIAKLKGKALLGLRRLDQALAWMQAIEAHVGDDIFAAQVAAGIRLARREYSQALNIADWILTMVPEDSVAIGIKSKALRGLYRFEEAAAVAREQIAKNPENIYARTDLAQSLLGLKNYEEALLNCQEILEKFPGDQVALGLAADAARALKNFALAHSFVDLKLEQEPRNGHGLFIKSEILIAEKRYDEALEVARRKYENEPFFPELSLNQILRIIQLRDGRTAARAEAQLILAAHPDHAKARDIMRNVWR